MKRYEFRLGRVLRVRRLQEEVASQHLRDATRAARRREAELDAARDRYETNVASAAGLRGSAGTAFGLRELDLAYAHEILDAQRRVEAAADDVGRATSEWTERRRRVAGLERLDERARAEYEHEVLAEEIGIVDDLVAGRHAREEEA